MKNKIILFSAVAFLAVILAGCGNTTSNTNSTNTNTQGGNAGIIETNPADDVGGQDFNPADDKAVKTQQDQATINNSMIPQMIIDKAKSYTAVLHTDAGDIEIALNASATPITANNFVWLAKKNFYDNVIFHRVIKDFMIQGGDPTGTGSGGPGYKFNDEPFTGEYTRGTVAMANSGPNTNGSQFFIMHKDVPLQKDYVIFGHVTKGLDVVDKIATAQTTLGSDNAMSKPVTPIKIKSVTIIEK